MLRMGMFFVERTPPKLQRGWVTLYRCGRGLGWG